MNNRFWSGLLALSLVASSVAVIAQNKSKSKPAAPSMATASNPKVNFKEFKLKNGLRVILAEDHTAPVISIAVNYDVGSRNERQGRTGFAHLFEHMMFQGSENIGKSEHFILIDNNGGTMNGTTNNDRTIYFETLPANQLDLALFLEADRMRGLDLSKENLDNQRNAVQEERRLRVDNQAYIGGLLQFEEVIYDNFNYKHSVIGSMEDLSAASLDDVKEFFRIYYAPNNAVLALVGDFKTDDVLARIKKQFESIPSQPAPPKVDMTEPEQTAERRFTVADGLAQVPVLLMGYKGVMSNTPDYYAMEVLDDIFTGGQSSRLYQKLIKEKQVAIQLFPAGVDARRGTGYYAVGAVVTPGKKLEDVEAIINEEIARLQSEPIADWELEKAKNRARRQAIQSLQSSLGVARSLAENAVAFNDPGLVNTELSKIAAVTKADVQRVAQKYLKATNRTVGHIVPKPKTANAPSVSTPASK